MNSDFCQSPARKLNQRSGSVRSDSSQASTSEPCRKIAKAARRRSINERNQQSSRPINEIDSIDEEDGKLFDINQ